MNGPLLSLLIVAVILVAMFLCTGGVGQITGH